MADLPTLAQLRCWSKIKGGNVYRRKRLAKRVASWARRNTSIVGAYWYRCPHCKWYHIAGKHPGGTEWLSATEEG